MPAIDNATIRRFYRDVGSRVRTARTGAGLTQDELAELVNVARSSIANLEAGRQRIPLHLFALIAEVVNTPAIDLLPRRPITEHVDEFFNVDEKLADAEDSRDFVTGALAHLTGKTKEGPPA